MNPIKLTINGVDQSQYLKGLDAEPSGPGVIGTYTLKLDKQAGGLDIRFGDEVKVWVTADAAGNGVAANGRLIGGVVAVRTTGNTATTKLWQLKCVSYNILMTKLVRYAAGTFSIHLPAGETFSDHVRRVLDAVQRNNAPDYPPIQIDGTTGVADLVASMPEAVLPPGKSLKWYLAALAKTARSLDPALWPAFYIDVDRSFGPTTVFGGPVLWAYDAALTPPITSHFTDTPGTPAGAALIYGRFKRSTDGSSVTQFRESVWGTEMLVASYKDDVSQGLYPNRFANHGRPGFTGYWMSEPLEDQDSASWSQAYATIKAAVQPVAAPRDSVEFTTDVLELPGEVAGITWALEGLVDTPMRVASMTWDFDDPTTIWGNITVGQLVLELGEDGTAILALPHEGDVAPQPPNSDLSVILNVVDEDPRLHRAHIELEAAESLSPNALYYRLYNAADNTIIVDQLTAAAGTVIAEFHWPVNQVLSVFMVAVNGAGQESLPTNTLTFVTALPVILPPADSAIDMGYFAPYGFYYHPGGGWRHITWTAPTTLPDRYEAIVREIANPDNIVWSSGSIDRMALVAEIGNMVVGVEYEWLIRAVVGPYYSSWSDPLTVTVPPPPAPAVTTAFDSSYDVANNTTENVITIPSPVVPNYDAFLVQVVIDNVPQAAALITALTYTFEAPPSSHLLWNYQTIVPGPVYSAPSPDNTGTAAAIIYPDPVTALMLDTSKGANGWLYSGLTGMQGYFKFTPPGGAFDRYIIKKWYLDGDDNVLDYAERYLDNTATTFAISQMQFGETYIISVGVDRDDNTIYTTINQAVPAQPPPAAPTNLAITLVTPQPDGSLTAKLTWDHSTSSHAFYWIRTTIVSGPSGQTPGTRGRIQVPGLYNSASIPLITPGVRYNFEVDTQDSYGFEGPYSTALPWTAPPPGKPIKQLPIGVIQATGDGAGLMGNVLATPTGTVTTGILAGGGLDLLLAPSASQAVSTYPLDCKSGDVLIAQVEADLVGSGITFSQTAQYYLAGIAVGSSVTVLTARAPDSLIYNTALTAPAGVDSVVVTALLTASGGSNQHVTLKRHNVRQSVSDNDINTITAGKITGQLLDGQIAGVAATKIAGVFTDPGQFQLETSVSAPRQIFDSAGVLRGQEFYNNGPDVVQLQGVNSDGTDVGLALKNNLGTADLFLDAAGSSTLQGTVIELWSGVGELGLHPATDLLVAPAGGTNIQSGFLNLPIANKTGGFSADKGVIYNCNAASGTFTVIVPAASTCLGRTYTFIKTDPSANVITFSVSLAGKINSFSAYQLIWQYQSVTIQSDGSAWYIVGQSLANTGTAFPTVGAAAAGYSFTRTDRGRTYTYNGSRWLENPKPLPFIGYSAPAPGLPYTGSGAIQVFALPTDYPYLISRFTVPVYVVGTNSSLAYWQIKLVRKTSGLVIASLDTKALAANTDARLETTAFTNNPTALTDLFLTIEITKVNTPGNLYVNGAAVYASEIG